MLQLEQQFFADQRLRDAPKRRSFFTTNFNNFTHLEALQVLLSLTLANFLGTISVIVTDVRLSSSHDTFLL